MAEKTRRYPYAPDYAVPPGETLKETLEALGMTQTDLAIRAGLSLKTINLIIHGTEPITVDTAIKLERVTGVPARMWNNLEMNYREQLAKVKDRENQQGDIEWLKTIPVDELIRRGVIRRESDEAAQLQAVLAFFGVNSVKVWKEYWQNRRIAARKSRRVESELGATATWIRLGELQAQQVRSGPYDRAAFKKVLDAIRAMTSNPPDDFGERLRELCKQCGVVLVFVREIAGAPWHGASWWHAGTPVIQLSLRYKTDDQFWFSFFHEAGHILNDSRKGLFINDGSTEDPQEVEANRFAADYLIPPEYASDMSTLGRSGSAVRAFAGRIGIAPGIVVGRMQKEGLLHYSFLNGLKTKFGWKDD